MKELRKEFEQIKYGNDSDSCQTGTCLIGSDNNNDYQEHLHECLAQAEHEGYETLSEKWERAKQCAENKLKGEDTPQEEEDEGLE